MKSVTYAALMVLIITVSFSSITPGFSLSSHPQNTFSAPTSQGLQVWFDNPQFISSGPCAYLLEVHAKTSSGLTVTSLHWDFGDNSTLDVPFSAQSLVSDSRSHIYSTGGTYDVSVVAYDSAGNTGSAGQTLTNVIPGSCNPDPGSDAPATISNAMVQQQTSLQLPSGGQLYLYGFVTGGGASSSTFSNGQYASIINGAGNLVAALAVTASNSNSYTTQTSYYSIGGASVSGYSSYTESYATDSTPASSGVSDHFTVTTAGSLVVVFALGGDEQCLTVSGLPGFNIDATNINSAAQTNVITIGHAYLDANSYIVTEQTQQCSAGQAPSHAGNLIGVFVFTPSASSIGTTTSQPPLQQPGTGQFTTLKITSVAFDYGSSPKFELNPNAPQNANCNAPPSETIVNECSSLVEEPNPYGRVDASLGYAQFTVTVNVQNTGSVDVSAPQSLVPNWGYLPALCSNSLPQGSDVTASCWQILGGAYPFSDAGGNSLLNNIHCGLSSNANLPAQGQAVALSYTCKVKEWTYAVQQSAFEQDVNTIVAVGKEAAGEAVGQTADQLAATAIGEKIPVGSSAVLGLQVLEQFGPSAGVFLTGGPQGKAFVYLMNQGSLTVGVAYTLGFPASDSYVPDYSALKGGGINAVVFGPQNIVDAAWDYIGLELSQDGFDATGIALDYVTAGLAVPITASASLAVAGLTAQDESTLLNYIAGASSVTSCQNVQNNVVVSITPTSSSIQTGQNVVFTASASGGSGSYSYAWTWQQQGNGPNLQHGTGTGNPYTFTPPTSGTYQVWVTVTDSCGNSNQSLYTQVTVTETSPAVNGWINALPQGQITSTAIDTDGASESLLWLSRNTPCHIGITYAPLSPEAVEIYASKDHTNWYDTGQGMTFLNSPNQANYNYNTNISSQSLSTLLSIPSSLWGTQFNPNPGAVGTIYFAIVDKTANTVNYLSIGLNSGLSATPATGSYISTFQEQGLDPNSRETSSIMLTGPNLSNPQIQSSSAPGYNSIWFANVPNGNYQLP